MLSPKLSELTSSLRIKAGVFQVDSLCFNKTSEIQQFNNSTDMYFTFVQILNVAKISNWGKF